MAHAIGGIVPLHEIASFQRHVCVTEENLPQVLKTMNNMVTGVLDVMWFVEIHLHVIDAVEGMVGSRNETMVERPEMLKTSAELVCDEGLPGGLAYCIA